MLVLKFSKLYKCLYSSCSIIDSETSYLNKHINCFLSRDILDPKTLLSAHAIIITIGHAHNKFLASKLIAFYASLNQSHYSTKVFVSLSFKDHFLWNSIIKAHFSNEERRVRCDLYDLHKELVPYVEAWSWQKAIVGDRRALSDRNEDFIDSLIILQHHPVYTMGTGSSEDYLNFDVNNAPFDVYRTERGGEVTYHGPGQLVMYPIINLRYYKMDLHWYLRSLEEVVIRALSSTFAIEASRVEGLTGVWVGDKKLAAIGIKVSKWITYHGLALNVTTDITPFRQIVPCGIRDRQVGSIEGLLNEKGSKVEEDNHHNTDQDLMYTACKSLVREFRDIFQVDFCQKTVMPN